MKEALKNIVDTFHRYNSEDMAAQAFGLSADVILVNVNNCCFID